jgi:putative transposase
MRKSRFTPEQILQALRQAESGTPVVDICRKLSVTETTFYRWKKQYGSLDTNELRELRQLREGEPAAQAGGRRPHARQDDPPGCSRKKMVSPAQRRAVVAWATNTYRVAERRACRALMIQRSSVRYQSVKPPDTAIRRRLHELAVARPSYGMRRLHVLLRRDGLRINLKKVRRLYLEEGLQLKPRRRRRRAATVRQVRSAPHRPDQRWAMDFMHDVLATGQTIRVFTLIDVFSRECITLAAARRFGGHDVANLLRDAGKERGALPEIIQCDNGTEFTSTALDHWAYWNNVKLDFSRPGKPVDNSVCEAFNGSLRRELLTQHWFASLAEMAAELAIWKEDYNHHRPHTSLGLLPPVQFRTGGAYQPRAAS